MPAGPTFVKLATQTVSGTGTTSITWSGISSNYGVLWLYGSAKTLITTSAVMSSVLQLRLNGNTNSQYMNRLWNPSVNSAQAAMYTDSSFNTSPVTLFNLGLIPTSSSSITNTNMFGEFNVRIFPTNATNQNKAVFSEGGYGVLTTTTTFSQRFSYSRFGGVLQNTSAVTSVTILAGGDAFAPNTTFTLYGLNS